MEEPSKIFLMRAGKKSGPYALETLQTYRQNHFFKKGDLLWDESKQDWLRIEQFSFAAIPPEPTMSLREKPNFFAIFTENINPKFLCLECHHVGKAKRKGSGSFLGNILIALILLAFWILPGILFILWTCIKNKTCACCGSHRIIPWKSPRAREILSQDS